MSAIKNFNALAQNSDSDSEDESTAYQTRGSTSIHQFGGFGALMSTDEDLSDSELTKAQLKRQERKAKKAAKKAAKAMKNYKSRIPEGQQITSFASASAGLEEPEDDEDKLFYDPDDVSACIFGNGTTPPDSHSAVKEVILSAIPRAFAAVEDTLGSVRDGEILSNVIQQFYDIETVHKGTHTPEPDEDEVGDAVVVPTILCKGGAPLSIDISRGTTGYHRLHALLTSFADVYTHLAKVLKCQEKAWRTSVGIPKDVQKALRTATKAVAVEIGDDRTKALWQQFSKCSRTWRTKAQKTRSTKSRGSTKDELVRAKAQMERMASKKTKRAIKL